MVDLEKVNSQKEKILETIKEKGPSLPVQISKELSISPLFAGAFLSELVSDKQLIMSKLKVGSSPLYYIQGQEGKLEEFSNHLNNREKEAFELLKSSGILRDEKQTPVIRVALRAIPDFAKPKKTQIDGKEEIIWAFHTLSDQEILDSLSGNPTKVKDIDSTKQIPEAEKPSETNEEEKVPQKEPKEEEEEERKTENEQKEEPSETQKQESVTEEQPQKSEKPNKSEDTQEKVRKEKDENENSAKFESPFEEEKEKEKPKVKEIKKTEIIEDVKEALKEKDFTIREVINSKKKEAILITETTTRIGIQRFYTFAKDKKRINDNDLTIALQKAQTSKMPALIVSPGSLTKKAEAYLKEWGNLIKFLQIG